MKSEDSGEREILLVVNLEAVAERILHEFPARGRNEFPLEVDDALRRDGCDLVEFV